MWQARLLPPLLAVALIWAFTLGGMTDPRSTLIRCQGEAKCQHDLFDCGTSTHFNQHFCLTDDYLHHPLSNTHNPGFIHEPILGSPDPFVSLTCMRIAAPRVENCLLHLLNSQATPASRLRAGTSWMSWLLSHPLQCDTRFKIQVETGEGTTCPCSWQRKPAKALRLESMTLWLSGYTEQIFLGHGHKPQPSHAFSIVAGEISRVIGGCFGF